MIYQIDTYRFLAGQPELIAQGKDWLAQCENHVTVWDFDWVMVVAAWVLSRAAL